MYKCSACGSEDKFVYGLINVSSDGAPKRVYINFCKECGKYYLYENFNGKINSQPSKKIELTEEEALELIVKMKSCNDPKDLDCKCNSHKFINTFKIQNIHRTISV